MERVSDERDNMRPRSYPFVTATSWTKTAFEFEKFIYLLSMIVDDCVNQT